MSYYKYAERSSESRVDWNEISKGMVDMLKEQTRLRNEKLDDALELQNTITTTLSEAPMGSDENANQRISGFASDAQEYMLMMNKLWRSGEMGYREYMAATNNFKTNANGYLTQAERYNEAYEVHKKRMDELLASGVEESELARVEDFGNFSKFTPVIDAPTGSIGLVDADGRSYASMTQLGVAVMSQYDRLDVNAATTDASKQIATTVRVLKKNGIRTLESALARDPRNPDEPTDYEKAENNLIAGILIDDNSHTSVLVDYDEGAYDVTHSVTEALADPNAILMVPSSRNKDRMIGSIEDDADFEKYLDQLTIDGEALTEEQKTTLRTNRDAQRERSIEAVREQLRARLDWEETPTADTTSRDSDTARKARERAESTVDVVTNIRKLHSLKEGESEEDVTAALNYIQQLNPNVRKIELGDEEIVIRMKDGDLIPITKGDQADLFVESVINAVYKDKAVNLPDALKKAGVYDEGLTRHSLGAIAGFDETVGYDDETAGFDPKTGKSADVTPRGIYVATTGEDSSPQGVTAAALSSLRLMNFDNPQLSVVELDPSGPFNSTDAVKYFVPGVMPYQVFVPEEGANTVVGLLNELVAEARADGRQVTIDELKAAIGSENYDLYNTQEFRNANPVEEPTIERPADNTQEEDPLGIL